MLRRESLGGVAVIVYFQLGKRSGGLKRIQIERPPHGVNPPALHAILAALDAAYGAADRHCVTPPRAANGFQATTNWSWLRGGTTIRAIFRDTTLDAVESCVGDKPPPCGLTARLLVRISRASGAPPGCEGPAP